MAFVWQNFSFGFQLHQQAPRSSFSSIPLDGSAPSFDKLSLDVNHLYVTTTNNNNTPCPSTPRRNVILSASATAEESSTEEVPNRSLYARRTIRLAYMAAHGMSRWGPSENRRAQSLAQSIVTASSSAGANGDSAAAPVTATAEAPAATAAATTTTTTASPAPAPAIPTEKEEQAEQDSKEARDALARKFGQWNPLKNIKKIQASAPAPEADSSPQPAAEPSEKSKDLPYFMKPVPSSSTTKAMMPESLVTTPEGLDEPEEIEAAAPVAPPEIPAVPAAEPPQPEAPTAEPPQPEAPKVVVAPEVPEKEAAPAVVASIPTSQDVSPGNAIQRRDLYKARTLQVAAGAKVGRSRWGTAEIRRANLMATTVMGAPTSQPVTKPQDLEKNVATPPKHEPQPQQPVPPRTIESRWSAVPVRTPLPRRTPRPQLAGVGGALLNTRNSASSNAKRVLLANPPGAGGSGSVTRPIRPTVGGSDSSTRTIQSNSRWARSSTPMPNLAFKRSSAPPQLPGSPGSAAAPPQLPGSPGSAAAPPQPPMTPTPKASSTGVKTVTRTSTPKPGLAAVTGPMNNIVRRRQVSINTDAGRPLRKPAVPAVRVYRGSSPAATTTSPGITEVKDPPVTKGPAITDEEVRALFDLWNNALATLDSSTVAKRYAADPLLLPTISDTPRTDFASIKDYFDTFLKLKPQGVILDGKIKKGDTWAQDAGIYEFTMGATGAKVKARYSFVYVFEDGEWKIAHQHSSAMPESGKDQITEEECRGLFNLWNDALATLDSDTVAKRYAKNAVLLPTVSDVPRTDYASIKDYFDIFLKLKPHGVILESFVTIGDGWCKDVGIYEFTMGSTGDKVRARYSFVYIKEDDEWKISHQHSSAMPESKLPNKLTIPEVRNLFTLWNDALATLDSDKVASRYAKDSVLLPTISDKPRTDYASKKDYFDIFLKNKPQGEILESYVQVGDGWCKDVGIYEFTMGTTGDKVKGRYSFVYTYEDGEWKISHHHSSVMPESVL
ncbi:hypothetical protein ACA910_004014 [Epithemia clementina (nom. ined.)]